MGSLLIQCQNRLSPPVIAVFFFSYDKDGNVRESGKFAATMQFVDQYLNGFISNAWMFKNRSENKLTFEVILRSRPKLI